LAACAAKKYFFEAPILLILLRKINKIGTSKDFICRRRRHNTFYTTPESLVA